MDLKKIYLFFLAAILLCLYAFRVGGDNFHYTELGMLIATLFTLIYFGYDSLKFFTLKSEVGKSIFYLNLGATSWAIGDIIYFIVNPGLFTMLDLTFNSFYFLGYLLLGIGTLRSIVAVSPNFFKDKKTLIIAASILIIGTIAHFYFIPFEWKTESTIAQNIVNAGYLIGDIFLLLLTVILIWKLIGTTFSWAWLLIGLGNIATWAADIYHILNIETYTAGDMIDFVYKLGYIFYALGFILLIDIAAKELSNLPESSAPPSPEVVISVKKSKNTRRKAKKARKKQNR